MGLQAIRSRNNLPAPVAAEPSETSVKIEVKILGLEFRCQAGVQSDGQEKIGHLFSQIMKKCSQATDAAYNLLYSRMPPPGQPYEKQAEVQVVEPEVERGL